MGQFYSVFSVSRLITSEITLAVYLIFSELNTGQIQESIGEAVNGIVKHFHKPEKEVSEPSCPLAQRSPLDIAVTLLCPSMSMCSG